MSDQATSHVTWVPAVEFGDRLRVVRTKYGKRMKRRYSQAQFAALIGTNASALKQWEANNNLPENPVEIAQTIQRVTGSPAAWLLGVMPPDGPGDMENPSTIWETNVVPLRPLPGLASAA